MRSPFHFSLLLDQPVNHSIRQYILPIYELYKNSSAKAQSATIPQCPVFCHHGRPCIWKHLSIFFRRESITRTLCHSRFRRLNRWANVKLSASFWEGYLLELDQRGCSWENVWNTVVLESIPLLEFSFLGFMMRFSSPPHLTSTSPHSTNFIAGACK